MLDIIDRFFAKKRGPKTGELLKKEVKLSKVNYQLSSLEKDITDTNVSKRSKEFFSLVKIAFKESLGLHYSATFQELQEEISKRKKEYPEEFRKQVHLFLDKVSVMEYGYPEFRDMVKNEHRDREALLRKYIKDMEIEGDHIKKETKKRIYHIINDDIPSSDRELLLKVAAEFRELVNRI